MSRKKARKPAHLLKGKYSQKELDGRKEKDEEIASLMTKEDLENVPESLNERGVKYYKLLLEQLKNIVVITDLDKPSLENLSDHLSIIEEARIHRKIHGNLIETNYGLKPNPSLKIIKDYTSSYLSLAKSLALTPEMRQHMQKLTEDSISQFASDDNVEYLNKALEKRLSGNG
ncbi:P27 family phage terminase small subunit [Peribacillus simplex]|uniref:P27 family phage terminase small subunit n=1 Tax=Peribacillus simplex TaxID=1478 RepID=UPI002E1AD00E|nr:P27 family phage terminase small subunit [Peribacillus simplex]MED4096828.1 P27 family phage terminase small subunit [Peribacillus simplex]